MPRIQGIRGREILDSRGFPTVEVDVTLEGGIRGRACVPSGASTGSHEALERRDGDMRRYQGKGVLQVLRSIHEIIAPVLQGMPAHQQALIDKTLISLDGTSRKTNLGANALLGVSLACAKAVSIFLKIPAYQWIGGMVRQLPVPLMNILNGGAHTNNQLDFQEFMIVPWGATSFRQSLEMGASVFHTLKHQLDRSGQGTQVGDEGGFAPAFRSTREALDSLMEAITQAGFKPGKDIALALDVAASEFLEGGAYHLKGEGKKGDAAWLITYYQELVKDYPIISLEDGLGEDDWQGWQALTQTLGDSVQLVGDDVFVTHQSRLKQGVEQGVANAILIKPNQVGTLTETLDVVKDAQRHGYGTIMSHRSGETEDSFLADLAVGARCSQIKTGSLARSERLSKYNQLLRIEEEMEKQAMFWGKQAFSVSHQF
ncbi:MAG: phosphopyruvate hydratase [Alphaproteobacteria bacterium]